MGPDTCPTRRLGCRHALPRSSRALAVSGPGLHRPLRAAKPRPHLGAEGGAGRAGSQWGEAEHKESGQWACVRGWAGAPRSQWERAGRGRAAGRRANGWRTGTLPRRRRRQVAAAPGAGQESVGVRVPEAGGRPGEPRGTREPPEAGGRSERGSGAGPLVGATPAPAPRQGRRPPQRALRSAGVGGGCLLPARWVRTAEVRPRAGCVPMAAGCRVGGRAPLGAGDGAPREGQCPPRQVTGGAGSPASG